MGKNWEELKRRLAEARAVEEALMLFEWDNETLAPAGAMERTAGTMERLSGIYFRMMTDPRMGELLETCAGECSAPEEQAVVREGKKKREELVKIPREEYEAFAGLTSRASLVWAKARKEGDYSLFAPVLKEILAYKKKFASYKAREGQSLYDVMLEEFEEEFPTEKLDRFFGQLKEEIVPLLKRIETEGSPVAADFLEGDYPEEQQEQLGRFLAEYVGFDFHRGAMAVSAHPFTTALHNHDVRLTTHYDRWVDHSMFSVIHESGHGIYEQGIADSLTQTPAGEGTSMGMHESQSRFFENMIGRNKAFWEPVYPRVQALFPRQLGGVGLEEFYRAINRVEPGPIRIDADELTYSLHIMIRYELEKALVGGEIGVEELPELWDRKYEEYLGIRPENVSRGVLQDIHWSQGSIGYFPSYALGSAFAAQIYAHMAEEMDMEGLLRAGRLDVVREYLREHIHRYGKMKNSRELLKEMTGKEFDPGCYIAYLKEKFGRIYGLNR